MLSVEEEIDETSNIKDDTGAKWFMMSSTMTTEQVDSEN